MRLRPIPLAAGISAVATAHTLVNAALLRRPDPHAGASDAPVAVLLPVRDEQDDVVGCLLSILKLRHDGDLRVLVGDDGSSDATARLAREVARTDSRVAVIEVPEPGEGWLGKPNACAALAAAAGPVATLVFVDADVRLDPDALAAALNLMDRTGWQFCSPYPRQVTGSWAERLVQPLLQWSWLTTVPLRLAESGAFPTMGIANGQFLVVDRDAYVRAGGHGAVRDHVVEDVALARALLRSGARGGVCDGSRLASCRMYRGGRELADGYAKSLWRAFGSPAGAASVVAALLAVYVAPAGAAVRGSRWGTFGFGAGVAGRFVAARVSGGRGWPDSLAHPASIVALTVLVARSFRDHRRGRLRWKGRAVVVRG